MTEWIKNSVVQLVVSDGIAPKEAEKKCKDIEHHINALYMTLKRKPHARTDKAIAQMKFLRIQLDDMLRMYDAQTMRERAERDELITGQRGKRHFHTLK